MFWCLVEFVVVLALVAVVASQQQPAAEQNRVDFSRRSGASETSKPPLPSPAAHAHAHAHAHANAARQRPAARRGAKHSRRPAPPPPQRRNRKKPSSIRRYVRGVDLSIRGAKSKAVSLNLRLIRLDKKTRAIIRRMRMQIKRIVSLAQRRAALLMKKIPKIVKQMKAKASAAVAKIQENAKAAENEGLADEVAAAKLQAKNVAATFDKKMKLMVKAIKIKVKGIISDARLQVNTIKQQIKRTIREAKARLYAKKLKNWEKRQEIRQKSTRQRLLKQAQEDERKRKIASLKEEKCRQRYNEVIERYRDTAALCKGMVKNSLKVCSHYLKVYKRVLFTAVKTKCSKVPLVTKAKNCIKERERYVQRVDRHFDQCSKETEAYKPFCYFNLHKHKGWLDKLKAACFPGASMVVEKDTKRKLALRRKLVELRIKRTQRLLRHQRRVSAHAHLVANLKKIRDEEDMKNNSEVKQKAKQRRLQEYRMKESSIKAKESAQKSKLSAKQRAKLASKLSTRLIRSRHTFNNIKTNALASGTGPLADMAKSINSIAPQLHAHTKTNAPVVDTANQKADSIIAAMTNQQ